MIKQRVFTTLGIVFSLLIVFGGWGLTSKLLESHEAELLGAVESVKVITPASTPENPSIETNYPTLTESELYKVLNIWELGTGEIPHEPRAGQLTMEQAITAGKEGLAFFSEHGMLRGEFTAFEKTNAYLCESELDLSQLIPTNQEMKPEDIRSDEELAPFYSYWTVSFSSDNVNATLIINAATGQIWKTKMEYPIAAIDLGELDDQTLANTFMASLGFEENALFEAVIQKKSTKIDDATSELTLDIHLITKK